MTLNLLESLRSEFDDGVVGSLAPLVHEDSAHTKAALGSIFPAVLGGLVSKGSTPGGASDILNLIGSHAARAPVSQQLAQMGGTGAPSLPSVGSGVLSSIFGDRTSRVIDWVASSSGVARNSASSLMGLVVPAVLGLLGREVNGGRPNAAGLMQLLAGQAGFLQSAAPAGLAGVLGLPTLGGLSQRPAAPIPARRSAGKWLIPLAVLGLLALFFVFRGRGARHEPVVTPVTPPAGPAAVQVPQPEPKPQSVGLPTLTLPDRVNLTVPATGVERRLIASLEDPTNAADKMTWFTLERLEFETGSAALKPTSKEQLDNIAAIMKAYPQVSLKIGGYTDSIGSAAANLALSQKRADTTMQELVARGIAPNRLEAEGYGQEHPVADNATEEGRQKNRRIDVRFTAR